MKKIYEDPSLEISVITVKDYLMDDGGGIGGGVGGSENVEDW